MENGAGGFPIRGRGGRCHSLEQSHRSWWSVAFACPEHFWCTQDLQFVEYLYEYLYAQDLQYEIYNIFWIFIEYLYEYICMDICFWCVGKGMEDRSWNIARIWAILAHESGNKI